ncbi:uncharacterized protein KD926_011386 [Aspergillus affinis]|uniref:uncharacterized protein n=1 Tax=Aspergillus affinis TaxID=1070780 RepID=UPI0022FE0230|nr:uncharacterized protein KD926_011386 [Aspergillus affinis]KAI9038048.1 hypothetical protein KD926_011386 [Aspergillus affinis]
MCNSQTAKFTRCGCIVSKAPVVCELGESCPLYNKMEIVDEDHLCLECYLDAGGEARWWRLVKELGAEEVVVEGNDEREEKEGNKQDQALNDSEESEESEDTLEEVEIAENTYKEKVEAEPAEPDYGVDVSRDCYPPVTVTLADLQLRKEERKEAEVAKLKVLYGEDYFEGI